VLLVSLQQLLADEGAVIAHCQQAWGLKLSHAPIAQVRDQSLLQSRGSRMSRLAARLVAADELEKALAASADRLGAGSRQPPQQVEARAASARHHDGRAAAR
jgi:hypothetical protein